MKSLQKVRSQGHVARGYSLHRPHALLQYNLLRVVADQLDRLQEQRWNLRRRRRVGEGRALRSRKGRKRTWSDGERWSCGERTQDGRGKEWEKGRTEYGGDDNARERVGGVKTAEEDIEESSMPETSPITSAISLGDGSGKNWEGSSAMTSSVSSSPRLTTSPIPLALTRNDTLIFAFFSVDGDDHDIRVPIVHNWMHTIKRIQRPIME